jgi:hypothetical protein
MTGILRFSLPSPVYASPEVGAELIPSPTPPDPEKNPEWAKTQLAFSVRIPRIVPATPVTFRIMTINIDNENAGGQILRIREEFGTALKILVERLDKVNPESMKRLDIDKVIASQIKRDNLFIPERFSYEAGQQVIEYISEEEQSTEALFNDIRNQKS